jgi:hypothetical protein
MGSVAIHPIMRIGNGVAEGPGGEKFPGPLDLHPGAGMAYRFAGNEVTAPGCLSPVRHSWSGGPGGVDATGTPDFIRDGAWHIENREANVVVPEAISR